MVCLLCMAKSLPSLFVFLLPRHSQSLFPQSGRKSHNLKKKRERKKDRGEGEEEKGRAGQEKEKEIWLLH